jgi:hypothetical protein
MLIVVKLCPFLKQLCPLRAILLRLQPPLLSWMTPLCLLGLVLKVSIVSFVVVEPLTRCAGEEEDDDNDDDDDDDDDVPSRVTPRRQRQQPSRGSAVGSREEASLRACLAGGTKPSPLEEFLLGAPRRRGLLWRLDGVGDPQVKSVRKANLLSALVFTRGIVVPVRAQCVYCVKTHGPFLSCAVAIGEDGAFVHGGSCANCLWHARGADCSFREYHLMSLSIVA